MKYVLFGHGGSGNHGCEAIIRTTLKMLPEEADIEVYSENVEKDKKYGIAGLAKYFQYRKKKDSIAGYYAGKAFSKFFGNYDLTNRFTLKDALKTKGAICLSVGGDNYCNAKPKMHASRNKLFSKNNKTVLWGCSVSPELMENSFYVEDMKRYALITARESLTYNALKNAGVVNVKLVSDPAFTLETMETELPRVFGEHKVVGINLSPLVMKYEKGENILLKNVKRLIQYIISETDYNIVLIPHVLLPHNNDLDPLKMLFEEFKNTNRIALIDSDETLNCCQLKYVISKCSFMVVARTHASIAAYSTCVPTLVLGYSVKSRGIATDIFGTSDNYVLPVDKISDAADVKKAFMWLTAHEADIKAHYKNVMPDYIQKAYLAAGYLKELG